MTRPDAILFDLDGTLVDSLTDLAAACNRTLAAFGFQEHPRDAYRIFVGEGARRLIQNALPPEGQERVDEVLAAFRSDYTANLLVETRPYPEVPAMLKALRALGIPVTVCTNKPHAMAERVVGATFPPETFAAISGPQDGVPHKPDPAMALAQAEALGATPARCWFVGDTRVDMDTAKAAGMVAVGVLWGFRSREELEAHGAQHLVASPSELVDLV